MSTDRRRALMQHLITTEAAAGHAIDRDADFMALVELWIEGDVDMVEVRRRYRIICKERLKQKRISVASGKGQTQPVPFTSEDELLAEIARITTPDHTV
ncbi:hypothetical protein QO002_006290 [Pararhizobium capsulatum DSM 1112]|uniref:Uncharacterized protein n=1 Tax=Pararhizobium capsulatum DSM 1112 TaxID=1121113 RepID=A0ABU0C1M0_9HYPH|nr:hypothetical protein [Pararhizobium capsulatum]MDQ0323666.1 hypothetical protein [Pararhizobium capsulatum DSM 1112]MDQ0324047.1 hypothetical protein [Pararhizobium capsulatum DSM 1112]MDQ0324083.1 hypothetical protein [Pararhizobium capsulatum DSM 1112]